MADLGVETVGLFSVNNEFGKVYVDGFREAAAEAGIEIIEEQTIEPAETTPPANQLSAIANAAPDAVMAIPLGAQCPTFTKELLNAKAVAAGWDPVVFQTNTCSSRLLMSQLAGGSADGVFTSGNLVYPSDPANAEIPGVKALLDAFAAGGFDRASTDLGTTGTGWSVGEYTVNILIKASESGTLSRKSIMEAARNIEFIPSLAREGVVYKMNGDEDPYALESLTVIQWDEETQNFIDLTDVNTDFES